MKQYAIRHISPLSAFRFGFVVGVIALLGPGAGVGVLTRLVISGLHAWLDAWPEFSRFGLDLPLLELLNLTAFAAWVERLNGWGWWFPLLVALGVILSGAISTGMTTVASATTYNFLATLSGGLVVGLEEVNPPALLRQPVNAQAALSGPVLLASNGQRWPLVPVGMTFGSAPSATIVLPGLAPRHAEIRFENNTYYVLYDLSGGQTWVNDRPVQGANLLKPGFRIRLGAYELLFQQGD